MSEPRSSSVCVHTPASAGCLPGSEVCASDRAHGPQGAEPSTISKGVSGPLSRRRDISVDGDGRPTWGCRRKGPSHSFWPVVATLATGPCSSQLTRTCPVTPHPVPREPWSEKAGDCPPSSRIFRGSWQNRVLSMVHVSPPEIQATRFPELGCVRTADRCEL